MKDNKSAFDREQLAENLRRILRSEHDRRYARGLDKSSQCLTRQAETPFGASARERALRRLIMTKQEKVELTARRLAEEIVDALEDVPFVCAICGHDASDPVHLNSPHDYEPTDRITVVLQTLRHAGHWFCRLAGEPLGALPSVQLPLEF